MWVPVLWTVSDTRCRRPSLLLPTACTHAHAHTHTHTVNTHWDALLCCSVQLPQCTPLPPPLTLRTVPPAAVLASPRGAAAPARLGDAAADGQRRQHHGSSAAQTAAPQQQSHQQQQQRRPRVGEGRPAISITAVYPTVTPALPGSPSALQREQQQQQQQWAAVPGGMPGKGLVRGPCTRI